jgi:RimJ/RimL family protein N-acetyltransferase
MRAVWASDRDNAAANQVHAQWASWRIWGSADGFGPCVTMGVLNDAAQLVAVMVYHNFDRKAGLIEISGAGDNPEWLKRHVLREMFAYPFAELGCQIVVMRVSERNTRLHRILTAYGFTSYKIARLRGRHEDEIVFTLTDDDWRNNRFNRSSSDCHGQEVSRAA